MNTILTFLILVSNTRLKYNYRFSALSYIYFLSSASISRKKIHISRIVLYITQFLIYFFIPYFLTYMKFKIGILSKLLFKCVKGILAIIRSPTAMMNHFIAVFFSPFCHTVS